MRHRQLAAIGEGGIAGGEVEQRHLIGAERQRGDRQQVGFEAAFMGGFDDCLAPDLQHQMHRHRIVGMGQRIGERGAPGIFQRVVLRRPAADRHRRIIDDRGRLEAGLERREIDEGLERRARLAQRIGGAVELARLVILAADDRPDRSVRRHRDERRLCRSIGRRLLLELLVDDLLGDLLHGEVDRALDLDHIFAGQVLLVDDVERLLIGPVEEPVGTVEGRLVDHFRRMLLGLEQLALADEADIEHPVEHHIGARPSPPRH